MSDWWGGFKKLDFRVLLNFLLFADTPGTAPLFQHEQSSNITGLQLDASPHKVLTYDRAGSFSTFNADKGPRRNSSVHYYEVNSIQHHSTDNGTAIQPPEEHNDYSDYEISGENVYISPDDVAPPNPKDTETPTNASCTSAQYIVVLKSSDETDVATSNDAVYSSTDLETSQNAAYGFTQCVDVDATTSSSNQPNDMAYISAQDASNCLDDGNGYEAVLA